MAPIRPVRLPKFRMNFLRFTTVILLLYFHSTSANTDLTVSEVAALVACHDEFIPYPKMNVEQVEGLSVVENSTENYETLITEFEKVNWLLSCLTSKLTLSEDALWFYANTLEDFRNKFKSQRTAINFKGTELLFRKKSKEVYQAIEVNRKLSTALELAMKVMQDSLVKGLLEKMLSEINMLEMREASANKSNLDEERYKRKLGDLERDIRNLALILEDKRANGYFTTKEAFLEMLKMLEGVLKNVSVRFDESREEFESWWSKEDAPKYGRTLYLIRHAEREDNINKEWNVKGAKGFKNPKSLRTDDSPLSARGIEQARRLAPQFANMEIDHIFASPYDRTMETAAQLLGERNDLRIEVEPGLIERRDMCEFDQPGFQEFDKLIEQYKLVDPSYKSVYDREALTPQEGADGDEDALIPRVRRTIGDILDQNEGDTFVLVTHSAAVGAAHIILTGMWNYVAQSTVSKFVEVGEKGSKNFQLEYTSDATHLLPEYDYHEDVEYKGLKKEQRENDFNVNEFFKKFTIRAY